MIPDDAPGGHCLDRLVAVKVLSLGPLADPDQIRRFRGEASAAGCLQHNHIVRIHEVGVHEGRHYIVMDSVEVIRWSHIFIIDSA